MDTLERRGALVLVQLVFKVHRSFVAKSAVDPLPVIVALDVLKEISPPFGSGGIAARQLDALAFVRGHEAFHGGVVIRIGGATHARLDAGRLQGRAMLRTGVLNATITMVEQARLRLA